MNKIGITSKDPRKFTTYIKSYLAKGYVLQDINYKVGWVFITYDATMVFNAPTVEISVGPFGNASRITHERDTSMSLQLTDLQKVTLTANTKNAAGNKVPVDSPTWVSSDPAIVSISAADTDPLSAVATALGPVGSAKISFSCFGSAGDVVALHSELEINVIPSALTSVIIEAGEPVSK